MSNPTISQLKAALQRQGVNVSNLSDIQIRQMCNERLALSLTGNKPKNNTDSFLKKYDYNVPYELPDGTSIYVAELDSFKLPSGNIISAYVDVGGKQYFRYFDKNNNPLTEDLFKLSEFTLNGKDLQYVNGQLYTSNFLNIKEIKAQKIIKNNQTNDNPYIVIKEKDNPIKNHYLYDDCDLKFDSNGKVDMAQFSISRLKQRYPSSNYNIIIADSIKLANSNAKQMITIRDKQGNLLRNIVVLTDGDIYYVKYNVDNSCTNYTFKNGDITSICNIDKNDNIDSIAYIELAGVKYRVETSRNDSKTISTYYNNNDEIVRIIENYNQKKVICKDYVNGILYSTMSSDSPEIKYNAVDLMNEIYCGNFYSKINENNVEKLIKLLNKDNIINCCMKYSELHNKDFITFLYSKVSDINNKHRERLIRHIEKCLGYQPNKKITNSQVKTQNYTSPYVYDVVFDGNQVSIYNKTTNKTSKIDIDKIFKDSERKFDKLAIISIMQKLPGEILEFIANEKISLISLYDNASKKMQDTFKKRGLAAFSGLYRNDIEQIIVDASANTIVHEVGHAVDYMVDSIVLSDRTPVIRKAFWDGLERYKADGYPVHSLIKSENTADSEKPDYYFSTNPQECWSRVFELLYLGHCDGQEILEKYWGEFIELEKAYIQLVQNAPDNLRHN